MERFDVVVCGAGPTGLFAALELKRHGIDSIMVLDNKQVPEIQDRTKSKALTMHPRSMEIMESCGLHRAFPEQAVEFRGFRIFNPNAEQLVEVPFAMPSKYKYTLSLPQYETESIFREKCIELGIEIRWNSQVRGVSQDVSQVKITYQNTETESAHTLSAKWVLACDGSHSTVRHSLNVPFEGYDIHTTMLMASCKVESPVYDQNHVSAVITDEGILAFLPEPHGRARIILDYNPEVGNTLPESISLEFFLEKVRERCPKLEIALSDDMWKTKFSIRQRVIQQLRCSRVFFLGDAAHTHSPAGGQGMNTGLQDGHNLAWKLALVLKGLAHTSLLDTYHEERKPVAENLIRNTSFQTHIVTTHNAITRVIRPLVMSSLSTVLSLNFVKEKMGPSVGMLNISYKSSSLTVDNAHTFLSFLSNAKFGAGDRVPDFPLEKVVYHHGREIEEGATLLPLIYSHRFCALIAFTSLDPTHIVDHIAEFQRTLRDAGFSRDADVLRLCAVLPSSVPFSIQQIEHLQEQVEIIVVDNEAEDIANGFGYGSEGSVSALLRPDGHLALRSSPANAEEIVYYLKGKVFF